MYFYTMPSGTEVQLRAMTGHEQDILSNKRLLQNGEAIEMFLHRCIVSIGDNDNVRREDVLKMLSGDRSFCMVKIRQISLGDELEVNMDCTRCSGHGEDVVNLNDLEVTPYPSEREGVVTLPASGRVIRFRPLNGEMEQRIAKLDNPTMTDNTIIRIIDIDGENVSRGVVNSLPLSDLSYLQGEMSRLEGGINTTIETRCVKCNTRLMDDVVGQVDFFFKGRNRDTRR